MCFILDSFYCCAFEFTNLILQCLICHLSHPRYFSSLTCCFSSQKFNFGLSFSSSFIITHTVISLLKLYYHTEMLKVDYVLHTVHFTPMTHLFCNWKCVLNGSHLFLSSSNHPPSGNHLFVLCIYNSVFWCLFICFCLSYPTLLSETVQCLSFSLSFISLEAYPLGSSVSQMARFHCFYINMYTPPLLCICLFFKIFCISSTYGILLFNFLVR